MADDATEPDVSLPASGPEVAEAGLALERSRALLECGDYGRVLRLLEPFAERVGPASSLGAELRLQLATALIGQGRTEEAAVWCRSLRGCADPDLRARARELQLVLDAPALERPRGWSLDLPPLGAGVSLEGLAGASRQSRSRRPVSPPPPPVGPTRSPWGFAAIAGLLLTLLLLASLLGGCVELRSELRMQGPGRVQLRQEIRSLSGTPGPWQRHLAEELAHRGFRSSVSGSTTLLEAGVLPAQEALRLLSDAVEAAAKGADLALPAPRFVLRERNWLVGVRQQLSLSIDLRAVPVLPGLVLSIDLSPFRPAALTLAEPAPPERLAADRLRWPLLPGHCNSLVLHAWRWSPLGLGTVAIALLLPLVLALQRLRRRLGYGLPELPA